MDFKTKYPEFAAVEQHIRKAHAERTVYLAHRIAAFVAAISQGLGRLVDSMGSGFAAESDRLAIESDPFLKRSVPRY